MCILVFLDLNHNESQVSSTESSCTKSEEVQSHEEVEEEEGGPTHNNTTTVGGVLSVQQLVLRRGFMLLIMIGILVAGILVKDVLLTLLKWILGPEQTVDTVQRGHWVFDDADVPESPITQVTACFWNQL